MSPIHWLLEDLKLTRQYTLDLLEHVDGADWYRQPMPGINPIAWQVGHLAVVEYFLCLKRLRGTLPEDEKLFPLAEYAEKFGKGSKPSAREADYPTRQQLLAALDSVHEQATSEIRQLDEAVLNESCGAPHPMFTTKGGAIRFCPKHEMLHTGQIALLRRLYGGEVLR